jgi:uncharacterized membrane protein YagU involved in acid resistance
MTAAYRTEHALRADDHGQLDYDDSSLPGQIVANVLRLGKVSDREVDDLGLVLKWGYGSVFGAWHVLLRRRLPEPWASVAFGATLISATFSLFPLLGKTPPPWKWPADVLATSIATHTVYVVAAALVDDRIGGSTETESATG